MFPRIAHLNDVLPHTRGKSEFVHIQKDGYSVIDYVYTDSDTFSSPHLLECRGIKFDANGNILSRPFQKFFNYGEKPARDAELDWSPSNITIMEKLDGSMIHPALIRGELVFMTRKGVTDTALQAMRECDYNPDMMVNLLKLGVTPMFEYVSPNNRIVVNYDRPQLIHLASRSTTGGLYLQYGSDVRVKNQFNSRDEILEYVKGLSGSEGFVVAFDDGHMVKIKADEYVLLHRNIDLAGSEKRVIELILNDKVDDLLPMLDEPRRVELESYRDQLNNSIRMTAKYIVARVEKLQSLSQRDFALTIQSEDPRWTQPILFSVRNGVQPREAVVKCFNTLGRTQADIDANRSILGVSPLNTRPM